MTNTHNAHNTRKIKPLCTRCGDPYAPARRAAGYDICLPCGDHAAMEERKSWCVLTPHKQGAMFFTAEYAREAAVGYNVKSVR